MARLIVKEIAEKQGLNQSRLQMKARVTPQLLNRYWNNHIQRVDLAELERIANALGVKPGDLIVPDAAESTNQREDAA